MEGKQNCYLSYEKKIGPYKTSWNPPTKGWRGRARNLFPYFMSFCISYKGLITGLNLDGIHKSDEGVLEILAQK